MSRTRNQRVGTERLDIAHCAFRHFQVDRLVDYVFFFSPTYNAPPRAGARAFSNLELGEDSVGVLLGASLSSQISRNVFALGNCTQSRLFNLVRDLEQVHVTNLLAHAHITIRQCRGMSRGVTHRSIIREERSKAVGLAKPLPSISGAEP